MMFSGIGQFVLCVLVIAVNLMSKVPGLNGEVFAVGGAAGWTVPRKGMVNYTEWATMLSSLNVGDTLLFTYSTGQHNVVQVAKEDFDRCRATSPIATFTDGQTLVNLPKEGQYWFICGFNGHCQAGQKFVIDVISLPAGRGPAPAPTSGDGSSPPLGPAAAFAPSVTLGMGPLPSAFGPAPFPFSSAPDTLYTRGGFLSLALLLATAILAVF